MIDLYGLNREQLTELIVSWGHKAFRAKQLHGWIYEQCAESFDEMGNLPAALRAELNDRATLGTMDIATEQRSTDGTVKRLYRLHDAQLIEAVLMPYASVRRTACISSQAGCAMGCVFCATGQMGFARHLTEGEIVEQAMRYRRELHAVGERLSNVVLMGMGEPFHNYDVAVASIRRLMSDLGIGARHITVSTVGMVPQILRFAEEGLQVTLAISLHSANNEERGKLMPVNRRWPIEELLDACRTYIKKTGRRVTFEWAVIQGENDNVEEARRLGKLLKGIHCHVNLIPLNPTAGYAGEPANPEAVSEFVDALASFGVPATVRVRRGIDIDAGCGQLKAAVQPRNGGA